MRLSQTDFAELVGLTTRQIHNLRKEGMPAEIEGRNVFLGTAAMRWYIEAKVDEERRKHERTHRDDLEIERLTHQNREAKVRADLAEGRAVLVDDVLEEWDEASGLIRAEILKLSTRHGDTVNPEDPAAGQEALDVVANDLLTGIQEALAPPEELAGAA